VDTKALGSGEDSMLLSELNSEEMANARLDEPTIISCSNNHPIFRFTKPVARKKTDGVNLECDNCFERVDQTKGYYRCKEQCDFDICHKCKESP